MIGEFVPAGALLNALRFWWLMVALMVAGGLVGWGASRARPALYEAEARYAASIDYVRTGPLTQFEEDTAYNLIRDIIQSTEIMQRVIDQAAAEGLALTMNDLISAGGVERHFNVAVLRVRDSDPARAERIANLWIEQARLAISQGYEHAARASQLDVYVKSLENCLLQSAAVQPASGLCDRTRFSDIQAELQASGTALSQERLASRGLFPGLVPGQVDRAVVSTKPVANQQNQFVLAGALLGLLAAVVLIELGLPARWIKRA